MITAVSARDAPQRRAARAATAGSEAVHAVLLTLHPGALGKRGVAKRVRKRR